MLFIWRANIPVRSMESTITAARPNLVVLAAQQLHTAASLLELAEMLANERVPVAFGGLVFTQVPNLHLAIPGYYLGNYLDRAISAIENIMVSLRPVAAQRIVTYEYKYGLDHFQTRQVLIEADIWQTMENEMPIRHLAVANQSFGRNIIAALTLGNMNFLDADINWVEGLLANHYELPADALANYLDTYYRAALRHLEEPGYIVLAWLARHLGQELPPEVQAVLKEKRSL